MGLFRSSGRTWDRMGHICSFRWTQQINVPLLLFPHRDKNRPSNKP